MNESLAQSPILKKPISLSPAGPLNLEIGRNSMSMPKITKVSFDEAQISAVPKAKPKRINNETTNVYELNINETVNIINIGRGLKDV